MKKLILFLLFMAQAFPQNNDCDDFAVLLDHYINSHIEIDTRIKFDFYYDAGKYDYMQITIFDDCYSYEITPIGHDNFILDDKRSYILMTLILEGFNLYSKMCPEIFGNEKEIFSKVVFIKKVSTVGYVGYKLDMNVNPDYLSTGLKSNGLFYGTNDNDKKEVDVIPNLDCSFGFTISDKEFVNFILTNPKY